MAILEGEVMKRPVGRPKIKLTDLPTDWKERTLAEMKMGASREEIYNWLDIDDSTFARLMREEPEFSGTIKRGEQLSKAWWLAVGRTQLRNKEFSYVGWYMNMKNRYGWKDKTEETVKFETVTPILGGESKQINATNDVKDEE